MTREEKDPLIGTRIREYEILELLGAGGMGSVYRARHTYLEEERAVKIIHSRLAGDTGFVDRFIREAKILSRLNHPNLVHLYEFGSLDEDSFFMVLELIRGESVLQRIRRLGRVPVTESIRMIQEAASGLHFAHQNGIIHRDLSPDNLILLQKGNEEITKVIDFGIAKPMVETSIHTSAYAFIGKPEYCSPEQCGLLEEGEVIDARADIYSLAITFYYMVTGILPFYSKSAQGYFLKHANELPKAPSAQNLGENFPAGLDQVLLKALSKKRQDRQASMSEFASELQAVLSKQTVPLFTEIEAGQIFAGRYLIEKKIGKGESGSVFKAQDQILKIPVALKTVSVDFEEDSIAIERFKREVILARKVTHPNVCRVYDIGHSDGIHYVSMELVEGRTLADLMRTQGRFPVDTAIPLLRQILTALKETHRLGIIHRDLKPQNIMVDSQLRPRIMDFGISVSSEVHRVTQAGALIGTPHYMAPETFEGKEIDSRADLYSIGVLMYALLTGRLPFDAPTPVAVIYSHMKSQPARPSELIPSFSPELEQIVLKALQKEPGQRFQTADEILAALMPFEAQPTQATILNEEQLSHKLLAEHRFAEAMKVLSSLLKKQPENTQWQKLYKSAVSEKIKKDIRRVKRLIHQKNIIQAQFIFERLGKLQPESTAILNQLKRLQEQLITQKQNMISDYLKQAGDLANQKDYLAAMACLASAWRLQPNDPEIISMQERIQAFQNQQILSRFDSKVEEARRMIERKEDEPAFAILEEILEEYPTHEDAAALRDSILQNRWQKIQERVKNAMQLSMDALSTMDFEVCATLLARLEDELEIDSCRDEIERIRLSINRMAAAFASADYDRIPRLLEKLMELDRFGWLEPHSSLFQALEDESQRRFHLKEKTRVDALSEARNQFSAGKHFHAVSILDELMRQQQSQEASDLRNEILDSFRKSRVEQAQDFASKLQWEEAIVCWKELLTLFPEDSLAETSIRSIEDRMAEERVAQERLMHGMKASYSLILKQKWVEAQEQIEEMLTLIKPGFRMMEAERQIQRLQAEIARQIHTQEKKRKKVQNDLLEVRHLYEQRNWPAAMDQLSMILDEEVVEEEALELRKGIEEQLEKEDLHLRFMLAFAKGKELFEQHRWQKAIEFWKKAVLLVEDENVRKWITEAENCLKKERHTRLSLIAMLAEAEQFIFYGNFEAAGNRLEKCKKSLSDDFSMNDLREQLAHLTVKLEEGIRRESETQAQTREQLESVAVLMQQRSYDEAAKLLDGILEQQPELEEAIRLRSEVMAAQKELRNVEETVKAIVKLLIQRKYRILPAFLVRLRESSKNTAYSEDGASIVDEFPLLALEMECGETHAVRERMESLFSRSLLLLQYENVLRDLANTLEKEKRKEIEIENIMQSGLESLKSGNREQAVHEMKKLDETVLEKSKDMPPASLEFLDRTMHTSNLEDQITEEDIQALEDQFLKNEIDEKLLDAHRLLEERDLKGARRVLMQILKVEPQNEIANQAIAKLDTFENSD